MGGFGWRVVTLGAWIALGCTPLHAAMVQCSDVKGGQTLFRPGECQTLEDPTEPPETAGKPASPSSSTRTPTRSGSSEIESLKKEFEEVKRKLIDLRDVGRHEINPAAKQEELRNRPAGPWKVSQTMVPALGEDERGFVKSAMINGHRYRLGERVDGGVVKEIARDRVIMQHDDKETVVPFNKITHPTQFGRVGTVPLIRDVYGMYTLKMRLNNNQEITAVVDTGASALLLPEDVVTWLLRSGTLKRSDSLGGAKVIIADGSMVDAEVFKIASLRVGDLELKDVRGISIPAGKKEKRKDSDKNKNKDKDKDKDKEKNDADKDDQKEEGKSDKKLFETELLTPLFGINELKRLGKWRIDHFNDQLIVEQ
ncbi:MAG: hypothetical protein G8237_03610 [Magnetococcales bacterium]|nr:hypothetical protein [Magnetococcales bacterium]